MENEKVKTLNDLDSYKWFIFYFDENSINLQFDCNKIEESLKAQRDKIKQFCIDTLTGIEHYADGFLFDTNAHIFSTPKTRGLLFSYEEYPILDTDTTKVVDGKYPLDYATEIVESNLDDIIDYMVQSGTETYNMRTNRGFGNRWSPYNEKELKQVIKLFNSGTWYDTLGALKNLYYEKTDNIPGCIIHCSIYCIHGFSGICKSSRMDGRKRKLVLLRLLRRSPYRYMEEIRK